MKRTTIAPAVAALALLILLAGPLAAQTALDAARYLPPDAIAILHLPSADNTWQKIQQSSTGRLYSDPAMQPFQQDATRRIESALDDKLEELWRELDIQQPPTLAELPRPHGEILIGLFLQPRTFMTPDWSGVTPEQMQRDDFNPDQLPETATEQPDFQVVALAQLGQSLPDARRLADKLIQAAVDDGVLLRRENVRSVEITILTEDPDADPDFDTFCFGFRDDWLVVGSSLKYIREVLTRMDAPGRDSLADAPGLQRALQQLGQADATLMLNPPRIIEVVSAAYGPDERAEFQSAISALGLDAVPAAGVVWNFTPDNPAQEAATRALIAIRGEPKGVLAMLAPRAIPTRPNRLVTRDVSVFAIAGYDLARFYDQLVALVWDLAQTNINGFIQPMMAATGQQGQPPVDFQHDLVGQLTSPVTYLQTLQRPYTDPQYLRTVAAVAVRDPETLDTALARVHDAFIAQGNPQLRRTLRNTTVYLLPAGMFNPAGPHAASQDASQVALAVVGDQLVVGNVASVEQAVRDLGRDDLEPITADETYQYAARRFPAQAGAFAYQDVAAVMEAFWEQLQAAGKAAPAPAEPVADPESAAQDFQAAFTPGANPMVAIAAWAQKQGYLDFSLLPDYDAVRNYFGPSVSWLTADQEGIWLESATLLSP